MSEPEPFPTSGPDDYRDRVFERIPASYRPWLHLASTVTLGGAAVALGAWRLRAPSLVELLAVPAMFVVSNGAEWWAHKELLHRRRRPLQELYDRHTPQHHRVFREDDMAVRAPKELKLVLLPAVGVLAVIAAAAPLSAFAGACLGQNVGWLVLMTSALYVVSYELTHMLYHLPADGVVGRSAIVRALRAHHARHHDPRLMQRWNFNVTIPLFDWLCGTIARPDEATRPRARRREREPCSTRS